MTVKYKNISARYVNAKSPNPNQNDLINLYAFYLGMMANIAYFHTNISAIIMGKLALKPYH